MAFKVSSTSVFSLKCRWIYNYASTGAYKPGMHNLWSPGLIRPPNVLYPALGPG